MHFFTTAEKVPKKFKHGKKAPKVLLKPSIAGTDCRVGWGLKKVQEIGADICYEIQDGPQACRMGDIFYNIKKKISELHKPKVFYDLPAKKGKADTSL